MGMIYHTIMDIYIFSWAFNHSCLLIFSSLNADTIITNLKS